MLDLDEQVKIYESQLQEMTDSFKHLQLENDFILQEQQTELQLVNQLSATRLKLVDGNTKELEIDIFSESDIAADQLETLKFIVQEDQNGLI